VDKGEPYHGDHVLASVTNPPILRSYLPQITRQSLPVHGRGDESADVVAEPVGIVSRSTAPVRRDHIALQVDNLDSKLADLAEKGVGFGALQRPAGDNGLKSSFVRDPDGYRCLFNGHGSPGRNERAPISSRPQASLTATPGLRADSVRRHGTALPRRVMLTR
jgi:catechol 2,3-dioxygenase-like lactoylglutathione lyase family enzyme